MTDARITAYYSKFHGGCTTNYRGSAAGLLEVLREMKASGAVAATVRTLEASGLRGTRKYVFRKVA